MKKNIPKVCYIIPEAGYQLAAHTAYLMNFVRELRHHLDVHVIVERGEGAEPQTEYQRFRFFPVRVLEMLIRCTRIRMRGYRIVYIHYSYVGALSARIVTWILGGKVLYWNCGMVWLFGPQPMLRLVLRTADYLVTGNETMRQAYEKHYGVPGKKIFVMPNWIDPERIPDTIFQTRAAIRARLKTPDSTPVMLFVHRLAPRKGSRYLPSIIEQIHARLPEAYIWIAGDGPDAPWLKDNLGNNQRIRFLGAVPNQEIPALMTAATALMMPSNEEGFPRVIIEAQGVGLPYTAFDVGGTREISPSQIRPHIHTAGDVPSLAASAVTLLTLPSDQYRTLSNALRGHATQFFRPRVANHLAQFIQRLYA